MDGRMATHIIPDALIEAPIALCGRSADLCGDVVEQRHADAVDIEALCDKCFCLWEPVNEADARLQAVAEYKARRDEYYERKRLQPRLLPGGCYLAPKPNALAYLAGVGSHRAKRALGQVDG